ncbi:hypothetical protein G2W53_041307 [Senna tora]|uniref:BED-type domain-containing protein n=1 Tax=Senna tora TaxID=362788 RepID=A0A834SFH9_9FABA|nr:hypothetical protein G2W53_041307 [Senna tora]
MPPRQEFPTGGLEGAPSADIGWHFGEPVAGNMNNVKCKICDKVIKGGITRLKQHKAHFKGQVHPCARVTTTVREGMMKFVKDKKAKKDDSKKRKEEFEARLRDDEQDEMEDLMDEDVQMRRTTQESIRSQREWEDRQRFRKRTGGGQNVYEEGGGSNARGGISGSGTSRLRLSESEYRAFQLRSTDINLVRSRSTKQPKITGGLMKTLRKKLGEAVSKLIIYERLSMNLASSSWLHNLINAAAEIGTGVKFPTPYEISDVYLESEFQSMKEWIDRMKMICQEKVVTIMCDGWTNVDCEAETSIEGDV